MKICWQSNAGWSTSGYGVQTGIFTPALAQAGHEVTVAAYYGVQGSPIIKDGILNLPPLRDAYLNDIIESHMLHTKADLLLTFMDIWVLNPQIYGALPWCPWVPIDSEPILPATLDALKSAKWIWAMSRWAEELIHKAELPQKTFYVPLAINTDEFRPINRAEARAKIGKTWERDLDGKFVVAMCSANVGVPSRKGFFEAFSAFAELAKQYDDALLYCHTDPLGLYGEPLDDVMALVGLDPQRVIFPNLYHYQMGMLNPAYLNTVYNAADVFLHASHGGGFEIPLVEAQAAGCPVICTAKTAMTELIFGGYPVLRTTPFMYSPGALQFLPDIGELRDGLAWFHKQWEWSDERARGVATERAVAYDYRHVLNTYMQPALDEIAEDLAREAVAKKTEPEVETPVPTEPEKHQTAIPAAPWHTYLTPPPRKSAVGTAW